MYIFLSVLTGVTLAVMVSLNGNLTAQYGVFPAAAIIHAVGSIAAVILCAFQKEKRKILGHKPLWIYLGGAIGVSTTVFQNIAYGNISMTGLIALGLLGQTATSLLIDAFGLFGMKRNRFRPESVPGLLLSLAGILIMFDSCEAATAVAAIISFAAGITVVLSRTFNAKLAEKTGALRSSMVAHLLGLPITVFIALLTTKGNIAEGAYAMPFRPWSYLGGVMGVCVILLCNLAVPKVSAYRLTILTFIGQIFTGVLLDLSLGNKYDSVSFWGGLVIAAGSALSYLLEYRATRKAECEKQ